jgi:hypothetical protein
MKPTKWAGGSGTKPTSADFAVEAAVCLPNFRYTANDRQDLCFLRPNVAHELRAITKDGAPAESHEWLKITGKAKVLTFHPDAHIIKITQATDQASLTSIGGLMLLKFHDTSDALRVVDWVRDNLKVDIVREQDKYCFLNKLCPCWKHPLTVT